jgi:hypothetical protein
LLAGDQYSFASLNSGDSRFNFGCPFSLDFDLLFNGSGRKELIHDFHAVVVVEALGGVENLLFGQAHHKSIES